VYEGTGRLGQGPGLLDHPGPAGQAQLADPEMMHALRRVFTEIDDDPEVCVAVLRGAGERAFCAGMDLKWSESLTKADRIEQGRLGEKTFAMMERLSIRCRRRARLRWSAAGWSWRWARTSSSATRTRRWAWSRSPCPRGRPTGEDDRGRRPGPAGVRRNAPGLGAASSGCRSGSAKAIAKEMLFTGVRLDAQRAAEDRPVNDVFTADEFDTKVASWPSGSPR